MSDSRTQTGFSLIELLLVMVIVGILAIVAVPSLLNARDAAEKAATIATLRTMHSNQMVYMSQRGRYARMNELNAYFRNSLGQTSGSQINRQHYIYVMSPNPTDTSLKTGYTILAVAIRNSRIRTMFSMSEDGRIETVIP
jgi:prepilin-type N-terminal cleavage/methylation domain-containing protein